MAIWAYLHSLRLTFRHLEPNDLDSLFALYCDPDVRRYFPDAPRTLAEAKEELDWFCMAIPGTRSWGCGPRTTSQPMI